MVGYGTMMHDTRIAGFASARCAFCAGAGDFRGKVDAVHVLQEVCFFVAVCYEMENLISRSFVSPLRLPSQETSYKQLLVMSNFCIFVFPCDFEVFRFT